MVAQAPGRYRVVRGGRCCSAYRLHHQSAERSYRAYRVFDRQASGKAVIEF
jgi:hypothetical protein